MVKRTPDQPQLFPASDGKDFAAMDVDEYAAKVAASAPRNPYITKDNLVARHYGLDEEPADLRHRHDAETETVVSMEQSTQQPTEAERQASMSRHPAARGKVALSGVESDPERPLYGLPKSKDRMARRQRNFYSTED